MNSLVKYILIDAGLTIVVFLVIAFIFYAYLRNKFNIPPITDFFGGRYEIYENTYYP